MGGGLSSRPLAGPAPTEVSQPPREEFPHCLNCGELHGDTACGLFMSATAQVSYHNDCFTG